MTPPIPLPQGAGAPPAPAGAARRRSWLPAVLVGHALTAAVLTAVSVALLATGQRGDDDAVHPAWSVLWAAGALAVLSLAVRWHGVREPTHRRYVWVTAGAWVLVPLTWTAALFASFFPAGFPEAWIFLAIGFSPVLLALAVAGAAVAWVVVTRR